VECMGCMGSGIAMQHVTPMSMPEYFLMMVVQKSRESYTVVLCADDVTDLAY
jgi:hypothetical protein